MSNTNILASLSMKEVSNETAATCSGGCSPTPLPRPVRPFPPFSLSSVILFDGANWNGKSRGIHGDTCNLGGFDNLTSSIVIRQGRWQLFEGANYQGRSVTLGPGRYTLARLVGFFSFPRDNSLSSLRQV